MSSRAKSCGLVAIGASTLVLAAACDPAFRLSGWVKSNTGRPIVGAAVSLSCDGAVQGMSVSTGADGSFVYNRIGWYPDTCLAVVRASGFEGRDLPIGPHCRKRPAHLKDACLDVRIDVVLSDSR